MHIAIEGCLHGELDKVYATLLYIQQEKNIKIDLLICCGDFQSLRNKEDMYAMSCPEKYLTMGNFYEYYTGKKKAPILTIFIGGNHEASNYLRELYFGGWVAENIYYLGSSNAIWVRKGNHQIRVGGISGIYKDWHYNKGYFERMPLNDKAKKSAYHIREFEVYKLNFLTNNIMDVFLSHDWPLGIHRHGNVEGLLRIKPFFRGEIENNTLGNPAMTYLLRRLAPKYWFSAHLHVKFTAEVPHQTKPYPTKFLALDKCLPKRNFLQVLNVSEEQKTMEEETKQADQTESTAHQAELFYDIEWLAIQKILANQTPISDYETHLFRNPTGNEWVAEDFEENAKKIDECKVLLSKKITDLRIPLNFQRTVEAYDPKKTQPFSVRDKLPINNQTEAYLKMLDVDPSRFENFLYYDHEKKQTGFTSGPTEVIKDVNDDEIDLGMDFGGVSSTQEQVPKPTTELVNRPAATNVDVNISLEDLPFK